MTKQRLDRVLVERGLADTQQKAQALIMAGLVYGEGGRLDKPGRPVPSDLVIVVRKPSPYVGRGGLKLAEALDRFELDVTGWTCADIGASTGGFTDCLLQRGAARVYAVDVDVTQIDRKLRADPRVVLVEKNARYLKREDFGPVPSFVVMDVSFISVLKIFPALGRLSPAGGRILSLLKPQFEARRGEVGEKGVIRDSGLHAAILERITKEAAALGFALLGLVRCSTPGQKGNREFFGLWSPEGLPPSQEAVLQWIREVTRDERD
jgi:23S rRNA (cytidine1920-2'-O)/16S rRNA (cytidine1409-2'-O)-methyltransferase